jgi:acetyltransferase-like isoleucine patch superfamily enzyme
MIGFIQARIRTVFWTIFYQVIGRLVFKKMGKGVKFEGWIDIPQRGGLITIGNGVRVCRLVEFSVPKSGTLVVGDGVYIGRGVIMSAHSKIVIGANTLVAENVSIHDNNHNHCTTDPNCTIPSQGFSSAPVEIGCNCWIGAHAILVKGSGLGAGCTVGAGAVVTKTFPARTTIIGVPARPI